MRLYKEMDMSAVTLLCAGRPLPLYDSGTRRVETSSHGGYTVSIEVNGFSVQEHTYYREAVEDLGLTMKPCRYELALQATAEDAAAEEDASTSSGGNSAFAIGAAITISGLILMGVAAVIVYFFRKNWRRWGGGYDDDET